MSPMSPMSHEHTGDQCRQRTDLERDGEPDHV